jgi:hypothetical protein
VARVFGYPSWKVIVSAQRGQYSKPGSYEPGFFSKQDLAEPLQARLFFVLTSRPFLPLRSSTHGFHHEKMRAFSTPVDSGTDAPHHQPMITRSCASRHSKKATLWGASDRCAR